MGRRIGAYYLVCNGMGRTIPRDPVEVLEQFFEAYAHNSVGPESRPKAILRGLGASYRGTREPFQSNS